MKIPVALKKALATLDPLPRACMDILVTSGITPLTAKKIDSLLPVLGFIITIDHVRSTLAQLAKDGHAMELRYYRAPRRYRLAPKYITMAIRQHKP